MEMIIEQGAKFQVEKRSATREEYQSLRSRSDWYTVGNQFAKTAFGKELYSVVVLDGPKVIGLGSVVGDGAIYFNILDIVVHPNYDNKSVSELIMDHIEGYFETIASQYAYIGVMAPGGTKKLYKKYGFVERKNNCSGMFKILIKRN